MLTLRLSFPIPLTNNNNNNHTRISFHKSKPISSIIQTKLHLTTISTKPSKSRQFVSAVITSEIEQVIEETSVSNGNDLMGVENEELLPLGIKREFMPNHVAVIMDGNVRWARKRGWPSSLGHEAGVSALRKLIELCCKWGIRVLTVFAFSFDNWNRPKMEVDFLMGLFERGIEAEVDNFIREDIRVSIIGDSSKLPNTLQKMIANTEEVTKNNSGLQLIVAVSYTGKYDIVQACQNIAYKVKDGLVQPEEINEHLIEQELQTNCTEFPYPDLLIRTSGELRFWSFRGTKEVSKLQLNAFEFGELSVYCPAAISKVKAEYKVNLDVLLRSYLSEDSVTDLTKAPSPFLLASDGHWEVLSMNNLD